MHIPKKILIAVGLIGVFLVGLLGSYLTLTYFQKGKVAIFNTQNSNKTPEPPKSDDGSYNVVLLGTGGTGHSGGGLTDSIIIVHGDPKSKTAAMITVPRDLWVSGNYKINAAAINVGNENLKGVLQNITGLKIDKYISINFDSFVKLINDLGGIEVDVPKAFSDNFYPIRGEENNTCGLSESEINSLKSKYSGFELEKNFTCRYEEIHYDKGPAIIKGDDALKFVRSRHGDSDFGRSLRQIAVIIAIEKKLLSNSSLNNVEKTFKNLSKLVSTDLDLATIKYLIELFVNPESYKISQVQLTTENVLNSSTSSGGSFILIPKAGMFNYSEVKKYILNNINK